MPRHAEVVARAVANAAPHAADAGLRYVDCGVSGGIWGLDGGYCLSLGGEPAAVERVVPFARQLARRGAGSPSGRCFFQPGRTWRVVSVGLR